MVNLLNEKKPKNDPVVPTSQHPDRDYLITLSLRYIVGAGCQQAVGSVQASDRCLNTLQCAIAIPLFDASGAFFLFSTIASIKPKRHLRKSLKM